MGSEIDFVEGRVLRWWFGLVIDRGGVLECRVAWFNFHSYIRTACPQKPPSEWVVSHALRHSWPQFLRGSSQGAILKKFPGSKICPRRCASGDVLQKDKTA
jgi:hypothetical protein